MQNPIMKYDAVEFKNICTDTIVSTAYILGCIIKDKENVKHMKTFIILTKQRYKLT